MSFERCFHAALCRALDSGPAPYIPTGTAIFDATSPWSADHINAPAPAGPITAFDNGVTVFNLAHVDPAASNRLLLVYVGYSGTGTGGSDIASITNNGGGPPFTLIYSSGAHGGPSGLSHLDIWAQPSAPPEWNDAVLTLANGVSGLKLFTVSMANAQQSGWTVVSAKGAIPNDAGTNPLTNAITVPADAVAASFAWADSDGSGSTPNGGQNATPPRTFGGNHLTTSQVTLWLLSGGGAQTVIAEEDMTGGAGGFGAHALASVVVRGA